MNADSPGRSLVMLRAAAATLLATLLALCIAWELWLAPLRPGGSWMALKGLPLALALPGLAAGRRYTFQWSSLLVLAYFTEGVTRAWSERGVGQALALLETALSLAVFAAVVAYARLTRPRPHRALVTPARSPLRRS